MEPQEATHILNISGSVATHLQEDFNDFHTKLLQTEQDIERLKGVYRRLKEIRVVMDFDDDGPKPEDVIVTTSETLISLGKTIARLETKREGLNLCINIGNSVGRYLNKFGNNISAIPKINQLPRM